MSVAPALRATVARLLLCAVLPALAAHAQAPRFEVTVAPEAHRGPLTGRLVLLVARTAQPEPRLQLSPVGPAIFGVDLEQLAPGRVAVVDTSAVGHPTALGALPPGEYFVQAVVNVYEQARRADGHTIWVHLNDGRQEFFTTASGNLYSDVQRVRIGDGGTVRVPITRVIPAAPRPADTEWVKRVRIQRHSSHAWTWGEFVRLFAATVRRSAPAGEDGRAWSY